jgi:hypothetical protein
MYEMNEQEEFCIAWRNAIIDERLLHNCQSQKKQKHIYNLCDIHFDEVCLNYIVYLNIKKASKVRLLTAGYVGFIWNLSLVNK